MVVIDGYTNPHFVYFRNTFASLDLELIQITHLSSTNGRRLRGKGILRVSDFDKQIQTTDTETLQATQANANEVNIFFVLLLLFSHMPINLKLCV